MQPTGNPEEPQRVHIGLDRVVLSAYGWPDIEVPPYTTPRTPAERLGFDTFETAVLDRFFALNRERAAAESTRHAARAKPAPSPQADPPALGDCTDRLALSRPECADSPGEAPCEKTSI